MAFVENEKPVVYTFIEMINEVDDTNSKRNRTYR